MTYFDHEAGRWASWSYTLDREFFGNTPAQAEQAREQGEAEAQAEATSPDTHFAVALDSGRRVFIPFTTLDAFCKRYDAEHPDAAEDSTRWAEAVDAFRASVRAVRRASDNLTAS